jgi:1-acyl-sn-glycerol-3-phosphate acyltransferase
MVSLLRSIIYTVVFYLGSVVYTVASFVSIPFGRPVIYYAPRGWAQFHYWCMRWLLGIRVVVEGTLPQTGAIVAFKHESMLETTEVLRLFDRPAVVFKAELLNIPLWGPAALAHGVIPVARETGATALRRMLKAGREAIAEARPVIIFPEGTRVPHGESAPLRPGVAGLYKALNLPVVPVALDSGRLWPRRGFVKHAGIVTFRVGETIPTGLPRDEVESRIYAGINALNV